MQELLHTFRRTFRPRVVVACAISTSSKHLQELFAGRTRDNADEPKLYVCKGHTCEAPVVGKEAIIERMQIK